MLKSGGSFLAVVRTSMRRTQPVFAAFENGGRKQQVKECGQPVEAGKQIHSRKEGSHANTLILTQ